MAVRIGMGESSEAKKQCLQERRVLDPTLVGWHFSHGGSSCESSIVNRIIAEVMISRVSLFTWLLVLT